MERIQLCLGHCNWDNYSVGHGPPEGYFCVDSVAKVLTLALWRGEPRAAGSTRVARVVLCFDGQPSYADFDGYRPGGYRNSARAPLAGARLPHAGIARWSMAPLAQNESAMPTASECAGCDVTFLMALALELPRRSWEENPWDLLWEEMLKVKQRAAELKGQIVDAFVTVNARALELCDVASAAICKRYASSERFRVYALLVSDSTGRLAQLAEVAPGALVLIAHLGEETNARVLAGDSLRELSESLIERLGPDEQRSERQCSDAGAIARWEQWLRRVPAAAEFETVRFPMPLAELCSRMPEEEQARLWWCQMMAQAVQSLQQATRTGAPLEKSTRDHALRWLAAHCIELATREPSLWAHACPVLSVYALCRRGRRPSFSKLSKRFVRDVQALHELHDPQNTMGFEGCEIDAGLGGRPFVEGPRLERTGRTTWVRQLNDAYEFFEEGEAQKNCLATQVPSSMMGGHAYYSAMLAGQRVTLSLKADHENNTWFLAQAAGFRNCALTDEARAALEELLEDSGVALEEVGNVAEWGPPDGDWAGLPVRTPGEPRGRDSGRANPFPDPIGVGSAWSERAQAGYREHRAARNHAPTQELGDAREQPQHESPTPVEPDNTPPEVAHIYQLMVESEFNAGVTPGSSLVTEGDGEWSFSDQHGDVGTVLLYNGSWSIKLPNVSLRAIPGGYQGARDMAMTFYDEPLSDGLW